MYAQIKLFSEVIPEAVSPNQPTVLENYALNIRENSTAFSLVADLLFDHGVPSVREKATLLTLLEKSDLLSKASGFISGNQKVMNTAHGRICSQLSTTVSQLPSNPNAFWRQACPSDDSPSAGSREQASSLTTAMSQTIGGAECTMMLVEKLDGIVNS